MIDFFYNLAISLIYNNENKKNKYNIDLFSTLPNEIIQKICENLNYLDQNNLCQTKKSINCIVKIICERKEIIKIFDSIKYEEKQQNVASWVVCLKKNKQAVEEINLVRLEDENYIEGSRAWLDYIKDPDSQNGHSDSSLCKFKVIRITTSLVLPTENKKLEAFINLIDKVNDLLQNRPKKT